MDDAADIRLQLLVEYLKGESGGPDDQGFSAQCTALVVLGNSLDIPKKSQDDLKSSVRSQCAFMYIEHLFAVAEAIQFSNDMGPSAITSTNPLTERTLEIGASPHITWSDRSSSFDVAATADA